MKFLEVGYREQIFGIQLIKDRAYGDVVLLYQKDNSGKEIGRIRVKTGYVLELIELLKIGVKGY